MGHDLVTPLDHDHAAAALPAGVRARPLVSSAGIFLAVMAAWILTNMDQSLFGYAVPDLMQTFGLSIDQIGLLISASFVAGMIATAACGTATDIFGARYTLPLCLGVSALLVGLQSLTTSAGLFSGLRIVSYALSTALAPICSALIANVYDDRRRPMMVAILNCGYPFGWFIASFAIVPLITGHGWRLPFMVGFVVAPVAFLLYLLLSAAGSVTRPAMTRADRARDSENRPLALLFGRYRRTALVTGAIFFFYGGAIAGTVFYLPTFYRVVRGYGAETAAQIVGLSYGVSMIGYVGSALVSQTLLSRRATTMLWMAAAAVGVTAMIWLPHTPTQDTVLFAISAVFFFGTAAIFQVYLLELFPREVRATAAGVCASGLCAGSVLFPIGVAWLSHVVGWPLALTLAVAPPLAVSILLLTLLPDGAGASDVPLSAEPRSA
jgi:MFS family permease